MVLVFVYLSSLSPPSLQHTFFTLSFSRCITMVTQLDSPSTPPSSTGSHSLNRLIESTFSYNGNIMLAAIISLLVVILFVLLLHLYARWFLEQARQRRRSSMSASHVLGPSRFHHFHTFTFETTLSNSPTKGLDASIIGSIPDFIYNSQDRDKLGLECVVCLSVFEDNEIGRKLPKCGHCFHVECIDMWLHSHSSCPICRAPVACEKNKVVEVSELSESVSGDVGLVDGDSTLEIVIEIPGSSDNDVAVSDSLSGSSSNAVASSMAQSLPMGCSFKRMLSRNRSLECKVHPSSNVHVSEA